MTEEVGVARREVVVPQEVGVEVEAGLGVGSQV